MSMLFFVVQPSTGIQFQPQKKLETKDVSKETGIESFRQYINLFQFNSKPTQNLYTFHSHNKNLKNSHT